MKVKKLESVMAESDLIAEIMEHRNEIMSQLLGLLQHAVKAMEDKTREVLSFRMADFASFALKFALSAGSDEEERIRRIFEKLSTEQSQFAFGRG